MKKSLRTILTVLCLLLMGGGLYAQSTPVQVSNVTQMMNGKNYYIYVIQPGQTVFSISRAYGLHYSTAVLKTDIHSIAVGDTVWLPVNAQSRAAVAQACGSAIAASNAPYQEIIVQQGQTLYALAKTYNTSVEKLEQMNPLVKSEGLKAGQTIKVPTSGTHSSTTTLPRTTPEPKKTSTTTDTKKATQAAVNLQRIDVRERISKDKIYVSVLMPLYLDRMNEISTTKFDVEQRGKKTYKSFEFIQFYEGILMAVEKLQQQGYKVVLNVVDVSAEDDATVTEAWNSHNCASSDIVIALLTRSPFAKAAQLAKESRTFIVSPMSTRDEILVDNPYVIKYMPSDKAIAKSMIDIMAKYHSGGHLYIIHSKARTEESMRNAFTSQLEGRSDIQWTLFDWSAVGKLSTTLKASSDNVIVNIFEQSREKDRIQVNNLLNRLVSLNQPPVLMTPANYVRDISDIDFSQLQKVNYHMLYTAYLDMNNPNHKDFIDSFKNHYRTDPTGVYAGVANDIMLYFVTALNQKGVAFWNNPEGFTAPSTLLFPLKIVRSQLGGFENQAVSIYRMEDFHLKPIR
ncbi:MAG: LysM peptidoglycan-binding domain-containing protein [Bacteroidales bacterium]|nr:LysM peptidoglycan-binding domain-containing protein [Bacteroidales bacterium]